MRTAITGATGFIGRYLVREFAQRGDHVRAAARAESDRSGFDDVSALEWQEWQLGDAAAARRLVAGCDAIVHAALHHPGGGFRGGEGDIDEFVEKNIGGTLQLIRAAMEAGVPRFVFISTCAVHGKILTDRLLDETHPLWPTSHYGAHKAAIEKFVHSFGLGEGYAICALRPTGVYGVAHPVAQSKWFGLVRNIVQGRTVTCERGGKEVHAADVAKSARLLTEADASRIAGEAFNCYDMWPPRFQGVAAKSADNRQRPGMRSSRTSSGHSA
jgi:nucleoside-diphosphate-sugar epimerase